MCYISHGVIQLVTLTMAVFPNTLLSTLGTSCLCVVVMTTISSTGAFIWYHQVLIWVIEGIMSVSYIIYVEIPLDLETISVSDLLYYCTAILAVGTSLLMISHHVQVYILTTMYHPHGDQGLLYHPVIMTAGYAVNYC